MSEAPATRKLVKTREPGIFKRGGRYVVVYRDAYGKQHKRAGGQTLKAAKDVKATLRAEVVHGEDTEASREKFALYALRWIEHYAGRTNRGVRKATRDDYRARLEQDSIPYLGQLQMREIRPKHLDGLAERVAGRASQRTRFGSRSRRSRRSSPTRCRRATFTATRLPAGGPVTRSSRSSTTTRPARTCGSTRT